MEVKRVEWVGVRDALYVRTDAAAAAGESFQESAAAAAALEETRDTEQTRILCDVLFRIRRNRVA